jgi:hypothetical protein
VSDEPRPGPAFQREVNAIVDAFKAGLTFDPPGIMPSEYRAALRMVGFPLDPEDDLDGPEFEFPNPPEDDGDEPLLEAPEED